MKTTLKHLWNEKKMALKERKYAKALQLNELIMDRISEEKNNG
jgi:hypothetical protein